MTRREVATEIIKATKERGVIPFCISLDRPNFDELLKDLPIPYMEEIDQKLLYSFDENSPRRTMVFGVPVVEDKKITGCIITL